MKIRFDIENNDLIMENNQKYETPVGTFKPGDATNQRQGFTYPGISWKNMYFGSYTRGSMFNYYLSPNEMCIRDRLQPSFLSIQIPVCLSGYISRLKSTHPLKRAVYSNNG